MLVPGQAILLTGIQIDSVPDNAFLPVAKMLTPLIQSINLP